MHGRGRRWRWWREGGCHTGMIVSLFLLLHLFFVTRQERRVFCLSHARASDRYVGVEVHDLSVRQLLYIDS